MAVRWPDGSFTGSVKVSPSPTPVEPEPEDKPVVKAEKKEASDGAR